MYACDEGAGDVGAQRERERTTSIFTVLFEVADQDHRLLECAAELGRGDEQRARLHRRGRERKRREGEDLGADVAARRPLATLPHQAALPCS